MKSICDITTPITANKLMALINQIALQEHCDGGDLIIQGQYLEGSELTIILDPVTIDGTFEIVEETPVTKDEVIETEDVSVETFLDSIPDEEIIVPVEK
jgi:hypothetical protein